MIYIYMQYIDLFIYISCISNINIFISTVDAALDDPDSQPAVSDPDSPGTDIESIPAARARGRGRPSSRAARSRRARAARAARSDRAVRVPSEPVVRGQAVVRRAQRGQHGQRPRLYVEPIPTNPTNAQEEVIPVIPPQPRLGVSHPESPAEKKSYKRARGPAQAAGNPIKVFSLNSTLCPDKKTRWHAHPPTNAVPIIDPQLVNSGGPSQRVQGITDHVDLFNMFMPDSVINEIVECTNIKIEELRLRVGENNRNKATFSNTNLLELKALIGVLVMTGARQDSHMNTDKMFSSTFFSGFYKSSFSGARFSFLLRALRFDDAATRNERLGGPQRNGDRFAHIRSVWDQVCQHSSTNTYVLS